ncbi:MAG: hypothetical protein K5765_08545 [Clostridia bacterium]|nr:hypothetical protein [Clostridia bacterium]
MDKVNNKKTEKGIKALIIILIIISFLIIAYVTGFGVLGVYIRIINKEYYANSYYAFRLADTYKDFIPQALEYDSRSNSFFVSGYTADNSTSPIYVVDKDSKVSKKLYIQKENGKKFTGHSGGIAVNGDYIYLAGSTSHCIYILSYQDALNAEDKAQIKIIGKYNLETEDDNIRVSFISVYENKVVVGEYFKTPFYTTPSNHKYTATTGEKFGGILLEFNLSNDPENSTFGISNEPSKLYYLPDLVQGIYKVDNKILLSCSSGLSRSTIAIYDDTKILNNYIGQKPIIGKNVDTYYFGNNALIKTINTPAMSEEIVYVDGYLYTLYESASPRFIFGRMVDADNCIGTKIDFYF